MPITGRKPDDCFNVFRHHLGKLIAATLTKSHQLHYDSKGPLRILCFRKGDPTTIPLRTKRHGTLHFSLAQSLEAVKDGDCYRLLTRQYWYRLQERPGLKEAAVLRWEFDPKQESPAEPAPCMHHLHMNASLLGVNLNEIHVPTGWVLIEDVFRFLIVELGTSPPCGSEKWPGILQQSAKLFELPSGIARLEA